jgi:hypothetical protein
VRDDEIRRLTQGVLVDLSSCFRSGEQFNDALIDFDFGFGFGLFYGA